MKNRKYERTTGCIKNSRFGGKSKVGAFNKSHCQNEREVLLSPLLLIHANRYLTAENTKKTQSSQRHLNDLSGLVIGAAINVHKALGPGLLESAYEECLHYELSKYDLLVEKQKPLPLTYEDVKLACGYRADLVVAGKLIIEVKSVDALSDIHLAQVLTYLKLSDCRLGLLMNFNVLKLKD